MDDIGSAAGITGPAIYRHFKNKEEILAAAVVRGSEQVLAKVQEIVSTSTDPRDTLERLARNFARATLRQPAIGAIVVSERRLLDAQTLAYVERSLRLHMEEWMHAFSQLRPDLSEGEARVMLHSVWGMLETPTRYQSGLGDAAVEEIMVGMVMNALLPKPRAAGKLRAS